MSSTESPIIDIRVLGAPQIVVGDQEAVKFAGLKGSVLSCLAVAHSERITAAELVDKVWRKPTKSADVQLRDCVSKLRDVAEELGRYYLIPTEASHGYQLAKDVYSTDVERFEAHLVTARVAIETSDPSKARHEADLALGMWSAPVPFFNCADSPGLDSARQHLVDGLIDSWRIWGQASFELGHYADTARRLNGPCDDFPHAERLTLLRMKSLVAIGEPAAALTAFKSHEDYLKNELNVRPGVGVSNYAARVMDTGERARHEESVLFTIPDSPTGWKPFIGRDNELARVENAFEGANRLTLIQGPAGAGKTRALHQTVTRFDRSITNLVYARGQRDNKPYGIVVSMLSNVVRGSDPDTWHEQLLPIPASVVSSILGHVDLPAPASPAEIAHGLTRWIRSRKDSWVFVIDDLQFADDASIELIVGLLSDATLDHLTVLAAMRPLQQSTESDSLSRLLAQLHQDGIATTIDLAPFGKTELAQMAGNHGIAMDHAQVDDLQARSGGNAFFADLLLEASDQSAHTIDAAINDRLRGMSDDAIYFLRLASCHGAEIHPDLVELLDVSANGIGEAIESSVILLDGGRIRFRHGILSERVYKSLDDRTRAQLHESWANALGQHPRWRIEAAHHALKASPFIDSSTAVRLIIAAAQSPLARSAPSSVLEMLESGRSIADEWSDPVEGAKIAVEICRNLDDSKPQRWTTERRRALELVHACEDATLAARLAHSSLARNFDGDADLIELLRSTQEERERWKASDRTDALLHARLAIETAETEPGDTPHHMATLAAAHPLESDDHLLGFAALRAQLCTATLAANPEVRLELAQRLTRLGIRHSHPDYELIGRLHQVIELMRARNLDDAETQLTQTAELAVERARPRYQALVQSCRAAIALHRGDREAALLHRDAANELAQQTTNSDIGLSVFAVEVMGAWSSDDFSHLREPVEAFWSEDAAPIHSCLLSACLASDGHIDRAQALLGDVCGSDLSRLPQGLLLAGCLGLAARTLTRTKDAQMTSSMLTMLEPLHGTDLVLGGGLGILGPAESLSLSLEEDL